MNLRDYRPFAAASVVAFSFTLTAMAQNTASIQGSAVDSATGKAVPGAVVIASRTTTPAARGVATSGYDGTYQILSLPAGTYNICLQVPGDGYLATCHWGSTATTVTLAAGQKLTGTKVALKAGSILKVHLDDPGQLLNQKTKKGYAPHLVMGVWSGGMFYPAHVAVKTAVTADYQVTIPFDTSLKFTIQSMSLGLGNAGKTALAANTDQQIFQHASAETTHVGFSYSILSALQ
jgi:hypothetical protein